MRPACRNRLRFYALSRPALLGTAAGLAIAGAMAARFAPPAEAQQGTPFPASPAASACSPSDLTLSAYERARKFGTVTVEVSAAVSRACSVGSISASFIGTAGETVPQANEAQATLDRSFNEPGDYVLATLVWDNSCAEQGTDALGPLGVTITVDTSSVVWPRLALTPFCRDREAALGLEIEVATEPTPFIVPGALLDARVDASTEGTWAQYLGSFVVYAGNQVCGTLSLPDPAARNTEGDAVFFLGRPLQPPECSTAGAPICVETPWRGDEAGLTLTKRLTLQPGQTLVFDSFESEPARDPGPQPTCSVPNPVPRAPATGTGSGSGGGKLASAIAALGGLMTLAGLGLGSRAFRNR